MKPRAAEPGWVERRAQGMGTVMTHRAFGRHADEALERVLDWAAQLEASMSRFVPSSDISAINSAAGRGCPVRVGGSTMRVLARALELSRTARGLFDVTIGPLVDLWRVTQREGSSDCSIPDDDGIRACLNLVDYRDLLLVAAAGFGPGTGASPAPDTGSAPGVGMAALARAGQSIDLGGIAKGYAADTFAEIFRSMSITSAFTNIGGNVMAVGGKPDGSPWRVGIEHPREDGRLVGALQVTDASVVTSGDYQRFFIDQAGVRRSHILDPRTGRPARSGLISATVVAPCSMDADALSTMVFVAGIEAGRECASSHDIYGMVLVDEDLTVWVSNESRLHFTAASGLTVRTM
jgi:thiamine biosynthesis lipoprotein